MAAALLLQVVTPGRAVVDETVDEVQLPGALGELGVLPGHTPLLAALSTGELTYRSRGTRETLAVAGGFAEVLPDRVTVLADSVERADEVDVAAARAERVAVEAAMRTASAEELDGLSARLRLAETRLRVAERARR